MTKELAATYSHLIGDIRFYPEGSSFENRDAYDGIVTVKWLDDHTVEFVGACGKHGVSRLQESIRLCSELGATRFRANRPNGHRMPRPWQIKESSPQMTTWELNLI